MKRSMTLCFSVALVVLGHGACGDGDGPATPDAGARADAAPGADSSPQPDANTGPCTFSEAADSTNDLFDDNGVPEDSGQGFAPGSSFTVCGAIDPANATADFADADFYSIAVTAAGNVRLELTQMSSEVLTNFVISLWTEEGDQIGYGKFATIHGVATVDGLTEGNYFVGVFADAPAPAAVVPYLIRVLENTNACPSDLNAPTYTEADESGAAHRANDMVAVSYTRTPAGQLTPNTADAPEATGIALAGGTVYHLRGNTALVAADGDEYLDRDTFAVATDATTNELTIRLNWPDGASDMDVFLFGDGDPAAEYASGTLIGTTADEVITTALPAATNYWLWVATYDDTANSGNTDLPLTYDVTLCPSTFTP